MSFEQMPIRLAIAYARRKQAELDAAAERLRSLTADFCPECFSTGPNWRLDICLICRKAGTE